MNAEQLQKIVSTASFDLFIGQIENEWFECKGQPYQIETEEGKRELAKDVSSFANADGGFIFIGIKTMKSTQHFGDEVESLRPLAQSLVNTVQYRDVIRSWIYPEVEGIDVAWVEVATQPGKGIVIITTPTQKDSIKPFLITKTLDGKKKVEIVFGYAQRKQDTNQPLSVIDLQRSLRSGFHYEERVKERLDGMEMLLRDTVQQNQVAGQKKTDGERIEKGIERAIEHGNLKNERVIIISAYPNQQNRLKTIFLTTDDSIRRHLEHPPTIRYAGWSLETLDQARIMRGEMIRVTNAERKVIDLYRDGTLIFAGLADHRFLAWHDEHKQRIHPIAIIEIIYSFMSFYGLVLKDLEQLPQDFTLRIDFKNLHLGGVKSFLVPNQLNSFAQMTGQGSVDSPDDSGTIEKTFATENFDAAAIGFEMVREVYLWFGLEEDKIPYTKTENGLKLIDVETIKKL